MPDVGDFATAPPPLQHNPIALQSSPQQGVLVIGKILRQVVPLPPAMTAMIYLFIFLSGGQI